MGLSALPAPASSYVCDSTSAVRRVCKQRFYHINDFFGREFQTEFSFCPEVLNVNKRAFQDICHILETQPIRNVDSCDWNHFGSTRWPLSRNKQITKIRDLRAEGSKAL